MSEIVTIEDSKVTACGVLLISSDHKVLAMAREGDTNALGLPAGGRHDGEPLTVCGQRELWEETGVVIDLTGNTEVFCAIPDDHQIGNPEYCATFVVRSESASTGFTLGAANLDEHGKSEGVAAWIEPEDMIDPNRAAFADYNKRLLEFAGLITKK